MKITFFRLKGYIKVLNGMGLDEVVLDFSTFKNRIILIQGENGCSKSTIISALTPTPDSSDSFRTDVFIDESGNRQIIEYPAEKEIHYMGLDECGNMSYYKILIKSIVDESKTRRSTKAFISKNGEELNPNGNVTSFKEIRDAVLGIDPTYLDLSSVSNENRGIVDMTPADRRRYMSAYIGSLDTYNNIYKVISKKVSSLKSYINTLNSKLYELGNDEEMRLNLFQLDNSLKAKQEERDQLLKDLAIAESTVNNVDPDNKMQDMYVSIQDRLVSLNSSISDTETTINGIATRLQLNPTKEIVDGEISSIVEAIHSHESKFDEKREYIANLMSLNESTTRKIEEDSSILSGIETNMIQDNIEKIVNDLRVEISSYERYVHPNDIQLLKTTSIDELTDLRDAFQFFMKEVETAESVSSEDDFQRAIMNASENGKSILQNMITKLSSSIASNEAKIESAIKNADKIESDIAKFKKFRSMRPKECTIDSCPYISSFVSMINKVGTDEEVRRLRAKAESLREENIRMENEINSTNIVGNISSILHNAISTIMSKKVTIRKFESISYMSNPDNIKSMIKIHSKFPDFEVVTEMIEKGKMYEQMVAAKEQLASLEGDLKVYRNNKSVIESLTKSIEKNKEEYAQRENDIKATTKDCSFISSIIEDLNSKLESLNKLSELISFYTELEKQKCDLRDEFNSVKDKIKLAKSAVDEMNDIKGRLTMVEQSIDPINEMINQLKFKLSTIAEYQTEFKDSSDKYEKMVFIRNACSPGNGLGIQSEYVKRYMNDIIIDCNRMLGYMFGGNIQLDVPVIDEKHFSVPFVGPNGIIVPDISAGSTAQKCMIGLVFSCVAMMKSSTRYNIPRFDEIDGGLDQSNRIVFINVLNSILDFMGSEQCVICSHNSEFDTQNTTRLVFSHSGIKIEQ